jgi:hypothetical protein
VIKIKLQVMNDQYSITIEANRSILAPSPHGEGWGGATPRARSDPSLTAAVRGDPHWIFTLRIDSPGRFGSRGHPPEVSQTRNGPPADSARGVPSENLSFRKAPRAESWIGKTASPNPSKGGEKERYACTGKGS